MTNTGSPPAAAVETPWPASGRFLYVGALRFNRQELTYTVHVRHWP